ncbi:armadillo-type protein [Pterulicium gracile]|uniref:Armadillo-type protein n=1 Tax=Pterulicium gracile TaxID=1884261 RepID=A0A5C3QPE3_9AGAR|nr:armadillo-type protein [Pterula gracilis]
MATSSADVVHRSPPGLTESIWAPRAQKPLSPDAWSSRSIAEALPPSRIRSSPKDLSQDFAVAPGPTGVTHGQQTSYGAYASTHLLQPKAVGAGVKDRARPSADANVADTTQHVEQLFRALNLDLSPEPFRNRPSLPALDLGSASLASPDVSPLSSASLLTPTDLSPARPQFGHKADPAYGLGSFMSPQHSSMLPGGLSGGGISPNSPTTNRTFDRISSSGLSYSPTYHSAPSSRPTNLSYPTTPNSSYNFVDSFTDFASPTHHSPSSPYFPTTPCRAEVGPFTDPMAHLSLNQQYQLASQQWRQNQAPFGSTLQRSSPLPPHTSPGRQMDWLRLSPNEKSFGASSAFPTDDILRPSFSHSGYSAPASSGHEPINFLSLLHPSSSPPYHVFVNRIIKSSDQQASIFLQQKLKVADNEERSKIIDAICTRGFEMMAHRFGNWAVQRCLEAAEAPEERRKIVACMRGRIVELATNCYGCHVLQKALDCEEDIRLLIVSELLTGDPAQTLINKHASHVWSKIMELTWTAPAPPIFAFVNRSLKGKWAALACHETGSLVVQHAFENLEDHAKDGIVEELLNQGPAVFSEVTKNQWGAYCIQHLLEHGSDDHKAMTIDLLINGLLDFATHEQGAKSINKAIKEGGKNVLSRVIQRMCEPSRSARRAMIVDLALSPTGSQLIASVLPAADKDQRALLYDCIRSHIVTLRGCKTGSKVIWLFDRMRAYYGY